MSRIYYLSTCDTCKRIMKEVGIDDRFEQQDIKFQPITEKQIDQMKGLSGSFEALFSRKARKYKELGLGEKELSETDYRDLILKEYTFLKRPVVIIENEIFIGNSAKNIEASKSAVARS